MAKRAAAKAKETSDIVIRREEAIDKVSIQKGFNEVFRTARSEIVWHWKFRKNPCGEMPGTVALSPSGDKILGFVGFRPFPWNYMGHRSVAVQTVDLFAKGDSRLFFSMELHAEEEARKKQFPIELAFPNDESYLGFLELGWHSLGGFQNFQKRLRIITELKRALKGSVPALILDKIYSLWVRAKCEWRIWYLRKRLPKSLQFQTSSKPPADWDDFWSELVSHETFSLWKDTAYFQWRYGENPEKKFRYHTLRSDQGLEACLVATEEPVTSRIAEFWVRNRNSHLGKLLLAYFEREAYLRGRERIQFVGMDRGFFGNVFRDFERLPNPHSHIIVKVLSSDSYLQQAVILPHNWTFVWGDCDEL